MSSHHVHVYFRIFFGESTVWCGQRFKIVGGVRKGCHDNGPKDDIVERGRWPSVFWGVCHPYNCKRCSFIKVMDTLHLMHHRRPSKIIQNRKGCSNMCIFECRCFTKMRTGVRCPELQRHFGKLPQHQFLWSDPSIGYSSSL